MEIKIEKLIYGGEGLAHHDGSTVFIPFVMPGERVSAQIVEQKKKFIRARVDRVIEPSPERLAARCPHFGVCGGCDYQHIPYDAQLKYKTEILRETLRRIGKIDWTGEITTHASPPWAYRNRAQWKVRALGDPVSSPEATDTPYAISENEKSSAALAIGYFRASSTALCAVETCSIISPLLLKTLLAFRSALAAGELPSQLREIEAFAGAADTKVILTCTFAGFPTRAPEVVAKFRQIAPEIESLVFHNPANDRMHLDGPGYVECEAAGNTYRVGHFSFFQVNRFLVDQMVQEIAESDEGGALAFDLFAGVGLFSLPLSKRFARVLAVESNPAAARDLETNTSGRIARGVRSIDVRTGDVEQFLDRYKEKPDLIVLDPPRAGLTPGIIKRLGRISPARITYVSCDPPTLARDLAALNNSGYDVCGIHLFDLFPQTFHMETVVHLRRRP